MANPAGQRRNPPVVNAFSKLLTKSEHDQLFNLLGRGCSTLATAVVQVFLAQPPNSWSKKCCGVACFVKDNSLRSYFIRVYDIVNGMKFWEQELYNQFKYIVADGKPFFHTFETDTCWAALNFANDAEAGDFCTAIEVKLRAKMQRKQGKEDKKRHAPEAAVRNRPKYAPPVPTQINIQPSPTTSKKKDKKDQGKKARLNKADISTPIHFTHVQHVGWGPKKGFDYNVMDPALQNWLETLGLDESQMQDEKNVEVINQFVDEHGGINAIKNNMSQRSRMPAPPPPPPGSAAPPPPPGNRGVPLPPPPSHGPAPNLPPSSRRGAPPPPSRALPPTPPSMPQPSMLSRPMAAPAPPPPTPSGGGGTPTSPLPPAVGAAPPPPPIIVGGGRGRMGLIDDIHKGTAFKRVDPDDQRAPANSGRGALLDQIRGGKALKKVDMSDREAEVTAPSFSQDDLGASLLNALRIRNCVIHSEDSDDDSDDDDFDDDDEEWE